MRVAMQWVLFLIAMAVAGCQSTGRPASEPRPATNPAGVQLYQKAPHNYEDLGIVEVAGDFQYGPNSTADRIVEELKAKAAAKGANGIWLFPPRDPGLVGYGAFYNDQYYMFPVRRSQPSATLARAIYVRE
ncbi:MAG: hypothetical protein ACM359_06315 [Bacillota bacterium]